MIRSAIIEQIRAKLNDIQPFDEHEVVAVENILEKPFKMYADAMLDEALRELLLISPLRFIRTKYFPLEGVLRQSSGGLVCCAVLSLSDDFLRLSFIQLSEWHRAVHEVQPMGGVAYEMNRNPYLTAGACKPAVFDCGGRQLELYPCRNKLEGTGAYVGFTSLTDTADSTILFDDVLLGSLTWLAAAKVLSSAGDERAKLAMGMFTEEMKSLGN